MVELDYRLVTFLDFAPIGDYMEKFLKFKIRPDKGRESKLSDKVISIELS